MLKSGDIVYATGNLHFFLNTYPIIPMGTKLTIQSVIDPFTYCIKGYNGFTFSHLEVKRYINVDDNIKLIQDALKTIGA